MSIKKIKRNVEYTYLFTPFVLCFFKIKIIITYKRVKMTSCFYNHPYFLNLNPHSFLSSPSFYLFLFFKKVSTIQEGCLDLELKMHGFIFFSFIFSFLGKPIFNKKESINKDDNKTSSVYNKNSL